MVARQLPRLVEGRGVRLTGAGRAGYTGAVRTIRVVLPFHLRTLAGLGGEAQVELVEPATLGALLDALEARYPMLRGTLRDHETQRRRPFIRFFGAQQDLSHEPADARLPEAVVRGAEPFLVVGAIAGG
jgi:molybdopterin synthase sulfur carrier subunit